MLHDSPHLPDYLRDLLQRVERETGYPVVLREQHLPGAHDAEVHFAHANSPVHEVVYAPAYAAYRLHFLLSSGWKALRFYQQPPEERVLPSTSEALPQELWMELCTRLPDQPPASLHKLGRFLRDGLVRQVTSMPSDIRVEQEIAKEFPLHRQEQDAYLRRQVRDLEDVVRPEIEAVFPGQLHAASVAINWVFIREVAQLTDIHVPRAFRTTPYARLGRQLQDILHQVQEAGYAGDRRVADAWAKELKMQRWFEWTPLGPNVADP